MSVEPDNPFTGASTAQISLIGALGGAFMSIGAPFVTAWTKQFSPRTIVAAGGVAFGIASILASFGTALWHFQLSQGLLFGLGVCNAFVPAMTVPPSWYQERRASAMGIISAGTGIGGLVWAPALQALIDQVGYRNCLRISGGITGIALVISALFLDWDPTTKQRFRESRLLETRSWHRQMWDIHLVNWDIARTRKFAAQVLANFAQSAVYYTPVFFLSAIARTFGFTPAEGATFIAISNACNAISKISAGWIADRLGRLKTISILSILTTLSIYTIWLPSTLVDSQLIGRRLYIAFVVCYGMFASPGVSLFPAMVVDLFGAKEFAEINGALYLVKVLGTLFGLPVAGVRRRSVWSERVCRDQWRVVSGQRPGDAVWPTGGGRAGAWGWRSGAEGVYERGDIRWRILCADLRR